jgi:hypothetical protein
MFRKHYKDPPPNAVSNPPRYDREALKARKAKQAEEAVSAMAEYEQNQRSMAERTAKLRAARLAQRPGGKNNKVDAV